MSRPTESVSIEAAKVGNKRKLNDCEYVEIIHEPYMECENILNCNQPSKKVKLTSSSYAVNSIITDTSSAIQQSFGHINSDEFKQVPYDTGQAALSSQRSSNMNQNMGELHSVVNNINDISYNYSISIPPISWQQTQFNKCNLITGIGQNQIGNSIPLLSDSLLLNPDIIEDSRKDINPTSGGNETSRCIESVDLADSFHLTDNRPSDISYLMSTPTKMTSQAFSSAISLSTAGIESLHTPHKEVCERSTLSICPLNVIGEVCHEKPSLCLITQANPPKRRLAPKPVSASKVVKVSPLLKKYRKISKKTVPTKLKFILPKQRHVKKIIKRRVLKCKPPKEITILSSIPVEVDEVLATPLPDDLSKETNSDNVADKNPIFDEEDDTLLEEEELEDEEDNVNMQKEEHLAALFKASSTIAEKRQNEKRNNGGQRLNKQQRRLQARIAALNCSEHEQEDVTSIALNFLKRAKSHLIQHPSVFSDLISVLQESESSGDMPEILYYKVSQILKDFPVLCDEFVMFLKPHQAMRVGKYNKYTQGLRLRDFVQKLQHLYGEHQLQIQKLVKLIQVLQSNDNSHENIDHIKEKIAPILRYPHLLESFAQCFSFEPPPPCLPSDYEDIVLDSPGTPDSCEHIDLIGEDQSASPERPCSCDCDTSQSSSQSKLNHCRSCSVKFIDGRVYVQSGKTLRPAKVTYLIDKKEEKEETQNINNKSKSARRSKTSQGNKESKT